MERCGVKNIAEGVHERYVITCYELWVLLWGGGGRADHARLCVPCARGEVFPRGAIRGWRIE